MMKWLAIAFSIICIVLGLHLTNKHRQLKECYRYYQFTSNPRLYGKYIRQGKKLMSSKSLPYLLDRDERDIPFTVAMINVSRKSQDNQVLWAIVRDTPPGQQIRVVCMAQLLGRGVFSVWAEIQQADIDMIATAMPVHIVHWKNLLLQYSGKPDTFLKRDTYPERHKFRALFRECIEKYESDAARRKTLKDKRQSTQCPSSDT